MMEEVNKLKVITGKYQSEEELITFVEKETETSNDKVTVFDMIYSDETFTFVPEPWKVILNDVSGEIINAPFDFRLTNDFNNLVNSIAIDSISEDIKELEAIETEGVKYLVSRFKKHIMTHVHYSKQVNIDTFFEIRRFYYIIYPEVNKLLYKLSDSFEVVHDTGIIRSFIENTPFYKIYIMTKNRRIYQCSIDENNDVVGKRIR
jgi:hypothetical protein